MMAAIPFDRTRQRVQQQFDEGLFTRGAQIAIEVGGECVLDAVIGDNGLGEPMSSVHLFRVYCTIKPIAALAVGRLLDEGLVDLDEPLAERLADLTVLADGVTLRHVLTHTAGLQRPTGVEMELMVPARRRGAVAAASRPPGWRLGIDAAYSEYAGWHVLGWLIEDVTGQTLREHLRERLLDPLAMESTWVGMTDAAYEQLLPRLGVNTDMRNLGGYPMLFERSRRVCTETNPAHGGYTNARDLARLYSCLLERLRGGGIDALPARRTIETFCSPARPEVYDEVLARECTYGLGFMTLLAQHDFSSRCSTRAFGHSGNVGASFAFADPEYDLAVGVVYNGIVGHEAAFLRRRALINALYADLDTDRTETTTTPTSEIPLPRRRRLRIRTRTPRSR
jgi:CubicO group peptidase (beta-lactamase class C family)